MNLITGAAGQAHITPGQDAHWHRGIVGTGTCIFETGERFAPEVVTNNRIKIKDGVGMIQGRMFNVDPSTYDEVTLDNGSQGYNRIDLIVAEITVNSGAGTQSIAWKVVKGTPSTSTPVVPTYTSGNLDNGDLTAGIPIAQVKLTGINITSCDSIARIAESIDSVKDSFNGSILVKTLTSNQFSVSANNYFEYNAACPTITGYVPMAISGYYIYGTRASYISVFASLIARNPSTGVFEYEIEGRNDSTSSASVRVQLAVVYVKTELIDLANSTFPWWS